MKTRITLAGAVLRAVVAGSLLFGLAPAADARNAEKAKPAAAKAAPQAAAEKKPSAGGPQEGIKVHGHWTIVIRDENGKEATRRQFENALQLDGRASLAALLSRDQPIADWIIFLSQVGVNGQPCALPSAPAACGIIERQSTQLPFPNAIDYAVGLTVQRDPADPSKVLLTGTRRATRDGEINAVDTWLGTCPAGPPSPTGCKDTQTFARFSDARSASGAFQAAPVKKNQAIDVTVSFSFQ